MFERFRAGTADKSPLTIAGDGRGVLCLHGITGTPFEVRQAVQDLNADAWHARRKTLWPLHRAFARGAALRALKRSNDTIE